MREHAPAKINLALHVTGRRQDGYHLLDSLVAFCAVGDTVTLAREGPAGLQLSGPFGATLSAGPDNLVQRAAALMQAPPLSLLLEKNLPPASGIGGGSADAAATLRGLARLLARPLPGPRAVLGLGADVPVCLAGRPARMRGIGEQLAPLPALPEAWLVLVNPRIEVPTRAVFAGLQSFENPPMPDRLPAWEDAASLAGWLALQRNDLAPPASASAPVIDEVLTALQAQPGCLLARMSGSGATCFGLFADEALALRAQGRLARGAPGWWVAAGALLR